MVVCSPGLSVHRFGYSVVYLKAFHVVRVRVQIIVTTDSSDNLCNNSKYSVANTVLIIQ